MSFQGVRVSVPCSECFYSISRATCRRHSKTERVHAGRRLVTAASQVGPAPGVARLGLEEMTNGVILDMSGRRASRAPDTEMKEGDKKDDRVLA